MKLSTKTLIVVFALAVAAAMTLTALAEYGSGAVTEGTTYTTEEMLTYAIQDEYMALAEYEAIVAAYGDSNPFTNLIPAEEHHIALLEGLFADYGYAVPENDAAGRVALPDSLDAAYDVGVEAELNNIAMYETFLAQGAPDDVTAVFEALKEASESHLTAFEQAADRTGLGGQNAYGRGNASDDANGNTNKNGSTNENARTYRDGTCMDDGAGAQNGGSRNNSGSRGNANQNRGNCPACTDDTNP